MRWPFSLKSKGSSSQYKSSITEKWYKKGNDFKPMRDKQYDWVWEYAQLRYGKAMEVSRYIEEKSIATLKFVSAVGTAAWAIFALLEAKSHICSVPVQVIVALAVLFLIASAVCAVLAFKPAQHLYPINEEAGIESVEQYDDKQQALGKFIWGLTAATEFEYDTISKKGRKVTSAIRLLTASVLLFIIALFGVVFL